MPKKSRGTSRRSARGVTAEQYGDICDVVERAWHNWPTEHDKENPFSHTSKYARAAAMKIVREILGLDFEPTRLTPERLRKLASYLKKNPD